MKCHSQCFLCVFLAATGNASSALKETVHGNPWAASDTMYFVQRERQQFFLLYTIWNWDTGWGYSYLERDTLHHRAMGLSRVTGWYKIVDMMASRTDGLRSLEQCQQKYSELTRCQKVRIPVLPVKDIVCSCCTQTYSGNLPPLLPPNRHSLPTQLPNAQQNTFTPSHTLLHATNFR